MQNFEYIKVWKFIWNVNSDLHMKMVITCCLPLNWENYVNLIMSLKGTIQNWISVKKYVKFKNENAITKGNYVNALFKLKSWKSMNDCIAKPSYITSNLKHC